MKKKFASKLPFPTLLTVIALALLTLFAVRVYTSVNNLSADFTWSSLFGLLFVILILGFAIAQVVFFLTVYFKSVTIDDKTIAVFELHKLKTTTVPFEEITGYSNSEVYFGKYGYKTPSIVLYYNSGKVAELLNDFITDLPQLEKELQNTGIPYLGVEPYNVGVFVREYQFSKK